MVTVPVKNTSKVLTPGHIRIAKRRAAGLCLNCGKRPPINGKVKCKACRANHAAYDVTRNAARRASGLCLKCGKRPPINGSQCKACRAYMRSEMRAHNA